MRMSSNVLFMFVGGGGGGVCVFMIQLLTLLKQIKHLILENKRRAG